MPAFFEYLRNIVYYLMFATVVGLFAPAGKYRKFVSLVLGFVLVLLIVSPLAGLFGNDEIPVTQWFFGDIRFDGEATPFTPEATYSTRWDTYLHGAFESQLEVQLSRLLSTNGFTMNSADFEYSADFAQITAVRVRVTPSPAPDDDTERVPFIRIQPAQVRPIIIGGQAETPADACPHADAVKILISQFYNLPTTHIYVTVLTNER